MKKKAKPKLKFAGTTKLPKPRPREAEGVTARPTRLDPALFEKGKKPTIEELEAILNDPTPHRIQLLPDGSICAVPDETEVAAKPKYKPSATALGIAKPEGRVRLGEPIPAQADMIPQIKALKQLTLLAIVKKCCKTYEENTGAKANQTRLIDFVRWCEDNSGLL